MPLNHRRQRTARLRPAWISRRWRGAAAERSATIYVVKNSLLLAVCCMLAAGSVHCVAADINAQLCREAFSQSFGGATQKGFTYRGRSLLVVIRCHTSGVATSEPFVLVQDKKDGWRCLFHAATSRFDMEATIDGDHLVLWRLDWTAGKKQRTEFIKYDLSTLEAAEPQHSADGSQPFRAETNRTSSATGSGR